MFRPTSRKLRGATRSSTLGRKGGLIVRDLGTIYSDLAGPEHLIRSPVAAFSFGKDGIPGGKGYEGKFRKSRSSERWTTSPRGNNRSRRGNEAGTFKRGVRNAERGRNRPASCRRRLQRKAAPLIPSCLA